MLFKQFDQLTLELVFFARVLPSANLASMLQFISFKQHLNIN
ncbi:hypothetical protein PMAG_b0114 [Pseudoalteromonas mariniglutinosa NCIMB 1770]|nr:hypothetical protein [Pseudoalteromonas mariniglutinosa NCIMB 1770]